jgi:hypothetical protein
MLTWDILAMGLATSAASVTLSKTHITEPARRWLGKKTKLAQASYLANCPYCISHWIAVGLVMGLPWQGFLQFLVQFGSVVAIAAIGIGVIMNLLGWHQKDLDELNEELTKVKTQLKEAENVIRELVG